MNENSLKAEKQMYISHKRDEAESNAGRSLLSEITRHANRTAIRCSEKLSKMKIGKQRLEA